MRLRTFTAPSMPEAMELVRLDMGDDAIIVSTQKGTDQNACIITAAIENDADLDAVLPEPEPEVAPALDPETRLAFLRQVLTAHGLPPHLIEPLVRGADTLDDVDPAMALAAAIDDRIDFMPLNIAQQRSPVMLAGAPGAGKTICAAKLAAQAKLNGHTVCIATTDAKRAGGVEQLEAYTRILEMDLITLGNAADITPHLARMHDADLTIIDTSGVNPFDDEHMQAVSDIAAAANAEIILVLAAGADAMESADTARAFSDLGARRMVVSRLDMTRRLGGILAAALVGRLAIANVSVNPGVADGLSQINPVSLAHLIVPDDDEDDLTRTKVAQ